MNPNKVEAPLTKKPLSLIRRRFTLNYEPSICRSKPGKRRRRRHIQESSEDSSFTTLWTPLDQVDQAKRRNQMTTTKNNSTTSSSTTNSILFNSFIAGALAGSLADLTVHPIDTINTRLKVTSGRHKGGTFGYIGRTIYREGFGALYKGIGPTIYQTLPMNAVWFVTYEFCKQTGTEYVSPGYGEYFKRKRACITYMESTVVDISIPPPSFKPVSLSLSRISFYSKTPKQVIF